MPQASASNTRIVGMPVHRPCVLLARNMHREPCAGINCRARRDWAGSLRTNAGLAQCLQPIFGITHAVDAATVSRKCRRQVATEIPGSRRTARRHPSCRSRPHLVSFDANAGENTSCRRLRAGSTRGGCQDRDRYVAALRRTPPRRQTGQRRRGRICSGRRRRAMMRVMEQQAKAQPFAEASRQMRQLRRVPFMHDHDVRSL